jgi:hypothetical protein
MIYSNRKTTIIRVQVLCFLLQTQLFELAREILQYLDILASASSTQISHTYLEFFIWHYGHLQWKGYKSGFCRLDFKKKHLQRLTIFPCKKAPRPKVALTRTRYLPEKKVSEKFVNGLFRVLGGF